MRSSVVLAALALIPALSACALIDDLTPAARVGPGQGQIEPIHAAAIAQDQAVFWVSSNGCTRKADLNPVVRRSGDASVITLRRLKEDRCENARPEGVEVRWSFRELGLAPGARVSVENPYQMPPN
jgi:hypothetical protein